MYGPYCGLVTTLQENVATFQRTNEGFDKFLSVSNRLFRRDVLLIVDEGYEQAARVQASAAERFFD